eukprot:10596110-Alexandrium_andersonii.AAC.1
MRAGGAKPGAAGAPCRGLAGSSQLGPRPGNRRAGCHSVPGGLRRQTPLRDVHQGGARRGRCRKRG